jgi:hypothetical protein
MHLNAAVQSLICSLAVIAGCATTSGTGPTVSRSGFDGSTVVDINPHGNDCSSMTCTGLGAQWSSATPDAAILKVQVFNDITAITGAKLNVDGQVIDLEPLRGLTNFDTSTPGLKISVKGYQVKLSDLRRIAGAQRAWLRVSTPSGYIEDRIVEGPADSKALHAIRRFLAAVDQARPAP